MNLDNWTSWIGALWVGLVWFVTTNIEASAGVWVSALGGAAYGAFRTDKSLPVMVVNCALGVFIGIAFAKLAVEFINFRDMSSSKVAIAFLAALLSEQLVDFLRRTLSTADLLKTVSSLLPWRKS